MQSIIILAAGQGKRMRSLTPKVLQKISSYPMIYHIIKEAKKLSDDIHIILYNDKEKIQSYLLSKFDNLNFHIQDYKNYPGTAGALRNITIKNENALILNGDMPLINSDILKQMFIKSDIVIGAMKTNEPYGYGRVVCDDENVIKIVEQKDANEEELKILEVNTGIYILSKEILEKYIKKISNDNNAKEYYLTDIVALAKKYNKTIKKVILPERYTKGVNSKYELAIAEEIMQDDIKAKWMLNGIKMLFPKTIYIDPDVIFKGECEIENNVHIKGACVIENSYIKTGSVIEKAHIIDSQIGPMARIREKSNIKKSKIGNFVETKKSNLFKVKAGHLSYLGDADIKEGTNIGAGTITCNYDGFNKHKTNIGKNVFIGSGVELIAPITIKDNVIIGAGSTLREDISSGSLALSISKLKIIKNYFFDVFLKNIKK
jgi:bifunctional UDP-N-acetylglucosamine pyrophosphorylase/glucosamine-1-phosphate N-acetyltransferase